MSNSVTPRAPAKDQRCTSSLKTATTLAKLGVPPSKRQWLRCFKIDQAPKIMMELSPFFSCWPATLLFTATHQSTKILSSICGARICNPKDCKIVYQICLVKTQETIKWSIVSPTWSQSGHFGGWVRPRRANLSAVQHLLCATVHKKKAK